MTKIITLNFCTLKMRDHIAIAEVNDGIHIDEYLSTIITDACLHYYDGKPFVYLSHRKHSYSVDVTKYTYINDIKNLKGFGVISTSLSARNAEIENLFISLPFEIFDTLDEAIKWANKILKNNGVKT